VDDFATRIRLSNGSEIISLPASQRQVRGYGEGVRLVILDEAGFQPDELWRAASYLALDERANGSRIVMVGTPWASGFSVRRSMRASGATPTMPRSTGLTRSILAWITPTWSGSAGASLPPSTPPRCSGNGRTRSARCSRGPCSSGRPPISTCRPSRSSSRRPGRSSIDWGVFYDCSAAVAAYRVHVRQLNPDADRAVFVAVPHVWPQATPLSNVVEEIVGAPAPWQYVSPETSGVAAMPAQEVLWKLRERFKHPRVRWVQNPVATTSARKTAVYGCILALLERGQLVLAAPSRPAPPARPEVRAAGAMPNAHARSAG
jgi:hypothetical protein